MYYFIKSRTGVEPKVVCNRFLSCEITQCFKLYHNIYIRNLRYRLYEDVRCTLINASFIDQPDCRSVRHWNFVTVHELLGRLHIVNQTGQINWHEICWGLCISLPLPYNCIKITNVYNSDCVECKVCFCLVLTYSVISVMLIWYITYHGITGHRILKPRQNVPNFARRRHFKTHLPEWKS